jgi:transposase
MIDSEPWASRPHPGPRAAALPLSSEQREAIVAAVRPAKTEVRVAKRAQALLLMADGVGPSDIVRLLGVHPRTVEKWKARFVGAEDLVCKLADAPRSGRPRSLSPKRTRRAS